MTRSTRIGLDLALLLGGAAAIVLPAVAAGILLVVLGGLWWRLRAPRRERGFVAAGFGLAAALLLATGAARLVPGLDPADWRTQATGRYADLWADLAATAAQARAELPPLAEAPDRETRLAWSRLFQRLAGGGPAAGATVSLVDPDGRVVVWEGPGLLQEPPGEALPAEGFAFRAGFGSVTLLAVEPLSDGERPWRVVAARSLPTDRLPFPDPGGSPEEAFRWTVLGSGPAVAGTVTLHPPGVPPAAVRRGAESAPAPWAPRAERLARALVALALFALAVLRGIGVLLLGATRVAPTHPAAAVATLLAASLVVAGSAVATTPIALLALAAGAALAGLGLVLKGPRHPAIAALAGVLGTGLLLLGTTVLQQQWRPWALGRSLWGGGDEVVLRLAALLAAIGLLALAGGACRTPAGRDRLAALAATVLAAAAAVHDRPLLAIPLLLAGGGVAAAWVRASAWRSRGAGPPVLVLLALLLAASAWQTGHRQAVRDRLAALLPELAPPRQQELQASWAELQGHFGELDLAALALRPVAGMGIRDLPFVLWGDSPLARADALSALTVLPPAGEPMPFSFGLPLTEEGELDLDPLRWEGIALPAWRDTLVAGESPLEVDGRRWGTVRWWLLPRPGFRLGAAPVEELAARLLRGGPGPGEIEGIPEPARYVLYGAADEPLVDPWSAGAPAPVSLASGRATTPDGPARVWSRRGTDGLEALFLPDLGVAAAWEVVGTHALGALLVAGVLVASAGLVGAVRPTFRALVGRGLRSYSKRLLLVYGALLLLPLLLLNAVLFRTVEERFLREQRGAGEAALGSAQQVLGEYVLSLEPGFGVETALDDELLVWLSRVIRHEVNLYWGSSINASSKRELFTAGLLPERIPGEIWARLGRPGAGIAGRTNRVGGVSYLELYAPLAIPGVPAAEQRLFLSVPLLAQQEEVDRELGLLRRRALLITAALALLAAVIATRISRSFTEPIQDLVEGTRRIAGGEASLGLAPSEVELAALVEAIDEMARRIAEGRERLLREKQVVERIVEHINAGIVSLDRSGRVVMRNRVAADQLGPVVGAPLAEVLDRDPTLGAVAAFVREEGDELRESTVRLRRGEEDREYRLVWVPVPGGGAPSALLVVEDATEVLRSQRLEAWAEMARIIAHEIKNPLTPIRLSTEHMVEVWKRHPEEFGEAFERCSRNILRQVDELQAIAQEFSVYSHIPRLDPKPGDLVAAMGRVADMYAGGAGGARVRFRPEVPAVEARFDERLLGRAVRNLLENAVRATREGGAVELSVSRNGDVATVAVADEGPGVPPDLLGRIFDPYFSTHDSGTGLGLPIARRVAEEHGGAIAARNRPEGGLVVAITIPLS